MIPPVLIRVYRRFVSLKPETMRIEQVGDTYHVVGMNTADASVRLRLRRDEETVDSPHMDLGHCEILMTIVSRLIQMATAHGLTPVIDDGVYDRLPYRSLMWEVADSEHSSPPTSVLLTLWDDEYGGKAADLEACKGKTLVEMTVESGLVSMHFQ